MLKIILTNFHLEKIIWIIKKNIRSMILVGLVGALIMGAYAFYAGETTYCAKISFYVYSKSDYVTDSGISLNTSEISSASQLLTSYRQIIYSNSFLKSLQEELDLPEVYTTTYLKKYITSQAVSNTTVFIVNVYDRDPIMAMNIANAIGRLAPDKIISVVKSGGIEVLDEAELPTIPYETTSVLKFTILGFIAGFGLVAIIALTKGLLDTTIRRKHELEDLFTIPILGEVPQINGKKKEKPQVILSDESSFAFREAYTDIRTNLLFTNRGEKCPIYAVTSCEPNEGKSTNTINLAIAYSKIDKKVLIIDADMRKSHLKKELGIDKKIESGLSQYLAGMVDTPFVNSYGENIDVLLCGTFPPNPAELLMSPNWKKLIEDSKEKYDVIFIDLPPVGVVSDALVVTDDVTAYIFIAREDVTKFNQEEICVRKVESVDGNICGFIYNGISQKSPDYYYRNYEKYGTYGK